MAPWDGRADGLRLRSVAALVAICFFSYAAAKSPVDTAIQANHTLTHTATHAHTYTHTDAAHSHPASTHAGSDAHASDDSSPAASAVSDDADPVAEVQVVLFGATSDLAWKYLWAVLLDLWVVTRPASLVVLGAGRESALTAVHRIHAHIRGGDGKPGLECSQAGKVSVAECARLREEFIRSVDYVSISGDHGYSDLVARLDARRSLRTVYPVSRLVYLAVAPSLHTRIVASLHAAGFDFGRGPEDPLRRRIPTYVVLEKPIGSDPMSAQMLLGEMGQFVPPSQTLIVDHYLGKTGVAAAVELHGRLMAAGSPWARFQASVMHTEVVNLEAVTAMGRTATYNDLGVLRDVMQNHMSVMFAASRANREHGWDSFARQRVFAITNFRDSVQFASDQLFGAQNLGHHGPRPRMDPRRQHQQPQTLSDVLRFRRYAGYKEEVAAERAVSDPNNATFSSLPYMFFEQATGCPATPTLDLTKFTQSVDPSARRWPSPSESRGPNYAPPTAASATAIFSGAPVSFVAGKALGMRTAYVRDYFVMPMASACGPPTITYHVQGSLVLPAGIRLSVNSSVLPHLPIDGAAILFTGLCLPIIPNPRNLFGQPAPQTAFHRRPFSEVPAEFMQQDETAQQQGPGAEAPVDDDAFTPASKLAWPAPWHWEIYEDHDAGVLLAIPSMKPEGDEPVAQQHAQKDDDDEWAVSEAVEAAVAAAAARASSGNRRMLFRRLGHIKATPGESGREAYRRIIASAITGDDALFMSAHEVTRLWDMWQPVLDFGEHYLTHACKHPRPLTYDIGDRAWLPILPSPFTRFASKATASELVVSEGQNSWRQVAADVITALWDGVRRRPQASLAICYEREMHALFDAFAELPAVATMPWPALQVWLAEESSTQSGNPSCRICQLLDDMLTRIHVPDTSIHPILTTNATELNMVASRALSDGAFDVVLATPACLERAVARHERAQARGLLNEAALESLFVSAWHPAQAAATSGNGTKYQGPVDVGLSAQALRQAAHLFVISPASPNDCQATVHTTADAQMTSGSSLCGAAPDAGVALQRVLGSLKASLPVIHHYMGVPFHLPADAVQLADTFAASS